RDRGLVNREGIAERLPAPERTDVEAARRDEAREVRDALDQLPEEQSRVIELAYFGGLTHAQIASMLQTPVGTVKGRMRLGLAKRRPSLPALRPRQALAGLAAAAIVALAVIAFVPGGGGGVRIVRAEVHAPRASAVLRLSGARGDLEIAGMPQTPPGRVYEVWLKGAGAPRPTNVLFTVSSRGEAKVGV